MQRMCWEDLALSAYRFHSRATLLIKNTKDQSHHLSHMPEGEKYRPGSLVLAYHGPLVYEAKVLKFREKGKQFVEIGDGKSEPLHVNKIPKFLADDDTYFLHYKGWSLKWDEWVSTERILELNDANLGLSRELRNARKTAIERLDSNKESDLELKGSSDRKRKMKDSPDGIPLSKSSSINGTTDSKLNGVGRKRSKNDNRSSYDIMIPLRPQLKTLLVDDWEFMTKDHKLVNLDKCTPVAKILESFYAYKTSVAKDEALDITREAMDGLRVFFDQSLTTTLLYRYERLQYSDLLEQNPGLRASEVYGLEHLLRLLAILPAQISLISMDSVSINVMMAEMKALLEYLDDNLDSFVGSYMNTSPAYDRLAGGQ